MVVSLQHLFIRISSETMSQSVDMIGYQQDNITITWSQNNEQQNHQQHNITITTTQNNSKTKTSKTTSPSQQPKTLNNRTRVNNDFGRKSNEQSIQQNRRTQMFLGRTKQEAQPWTTTSVNQYNQEQNRKHKPNTAAWRKRTNTNHLPCEA